MAQGKRHPQNHKIHDQPSRPNIERGRAPNLNNTCKGHGDQSSSGQVGGASKVKDPGGYGHTTIATATQVGIPLKDSAYDEPIDATETIKGQEGVERQPIQVGRSRMATIPPEGGMCQCTCINCLCNRNMNHGYHFTNESSPEPSYTDSPPPSLLAEDDDDRSDPASASELSRFDSNLSDVLRGIGGGTTHGAWEENFVRNPLALIEGVPRYAPSLSGSEFDAFLR